MTGRRWILLSAVCWIGGAALYRNDVLMYIAAAAHGLYWVIHTIEVKVNKLLDYHGIVVTDKDLKDAP